MRALEFLCQPIHHNSDWLQSRVVIGTKITGHNGLKSEEKEKVQQHLHFQNIFFFFQIVLLVEIYVIWFISNFNNFLYKFKPNMFAGRRSNRELLLGHPCRKVTFTHNWHADMMIIITAERGTRYSHFLMFQNKQNYHQIGRWVWPGLRVARRIEDTWIGPSLAVK